MKKNYFLRTAAALLVGVMFGLCIIPGTMSRYGDTITINSPSVRAGLFEVAIQRGVLSDGVTPNWVSITRGAVGQNIEIDLFETLLKVDLATPHPVGYGAGSTNQGTISNKKGYIAPGCGGKFKITVRNFSEVKVNLTVAQVGSLAVTGGAMDPNMIQWMGTGGWQAAFPGVSGGTAPLESQPLALQLDPVGAVASEWSEVFEWRWLFDRSIDDSGTYKTDPAVGGLNTVAPDLGGYQGLSATGWRNISDVADTNLGIGSSGATQTVLSLNLNIDVEQMD